jgi:glucose/arabinose dehydrogenase
MIRFVGSILFLGLLSCSPNDGKQRAGFGIAENSNQDNIQLDKIELPDGFEIDIFASGLRDARSLALSPNGTIFVGTRRVGNVYAVVDEDGDYKVDKTYVLDEGLKMPNGVAFRDGSLYVAEVNRVLRYDRIEENLSNPPEPVVVTDRFPTKTHHGWKFIDFGPDGKLYVPVGAPCNICESEEIFASLTRMNPDGSDFEIVQHGIRNTVGFTWHPDTKELWFTDNGRDWMGDDLPACELNHAPRDGMHFGFPYCHQGDLPDPKFGDKYPCSDFTAPAQNLGPHTAPLGLLFYRGEQFPDSYRDQLLIAEHGSWNRSTPIGYRITMVTLDGDRSTGYSTFADGWLSDGEVWGRPVDVKLLPDGSMLVSDDLAGAIYRIHYSGPQ